MKEIGFDKNHQTENHPDQIEKKTEEQWCDRTDVDIREQSDSDIRKFDKQHVENEMEKRNPVDHHDLDWDEVKTVNNGMEQYYSDKQD